MIKYITGFIKMLNDINDYTNRMYEPLIQQKISERKLSLLFRTADIKELKNNYYNEYKKFSFSKKAIIYLKHYTPIIITILEKLKIINFLTFLRFRKKVSNISKYSSGE